MARREITAEDRRRIHDVVEISDGKLIAKTLTNRRKPGDVCKRYPQGVRLIGRLLLPHEIDEVFGLPPGTFEAANPLSDVSEEQKLRLARCSSGPKNTDMEPWSPTWSELCDELSKALAGEKDGSYYVRGACTSPRGDESMPAGATLLIIDGDKSVDPASGEIVDKCVPPEDAHEALRSMGIPHLLHTSYSHDPAKGINKWRAIIECPMQTRGELHAMSNWIIDQLNERGVQIVWVKEMSAMSQPWFFPRLRSDDSQLHVVRYDLEEGEEHPLSRELVERVTAEWKAKGTTIEAGAERGSERDGKSPIGRFLKKFDNADFITGLLEEHAGCSLVGSDVVNGKVAYRLVPPDSTTGAAGVHVYRGKNDGTWLVFSHNGSFELPMKAMDAFGVFQWLVHDNDQTAALADAKRMVAEAEGDLSYDTASELIETSLGIESERDRATALKDLAKQISASSLIDNADRGALLKRIAKHAGYSVADLRKDVKEVAADKEFDHLEAAKEVIKLVGPENVVGQPAFLWEWDTRGVWKPAEDRAIKQKIHLVVAKKTLTKSICESVLDLFKTEVFKPDIRFNSGVSAINLPTGELHWDGHSFVLKPHDREGYRTTQLPVEYDPSAEAPRFAQFLNEVFEGAEDKKQVTLELMGYSMLADCRFERFVMLLGEGSNGKSVLLSTLTALLGVENVTAVQPSQFDNKFQRAHLHGKLANIVTELKEGAELPDDVLKGIVSGELTTAEHKHKPPFDFSPFATCWFGANHMPHTRDFSDAIFRRAIVIHFNRQFKGAEKDVDLSSKLKKELPGILNMAVRALGELLTRGDFTEPESCAQAKQDWRFQCDQVARFVEDCCEKVPGAFVETGLIFSVYKSWAHEEGIAKHSAKQGLSARLVRQGFEVGHNSTKTTRGVHGIRIKDSVPSHWRF